MTLKRCEILFVSNQVDAFKLELDADERRVVRAKVVGAIENWPQSERRRRKGSMAGSMAAKRMFQKYKLVLKKKVSKKVKKKERCFARLKNVKML